MNLQVNANQSFAQLPTSRPAAQEAAKQASAQTAQTSTDSVKLSHGLGVSLLGGTGAALGSGALATAAVTLITERGIPKDFVGYMAAGAAVSGAVGLVGAGAALALNSKNPTNGALVGAAVSAVAAGAYLGKTLGTPSAALLGAGLGALAGGVGGYVAAKIRN